MKYAKLSHLDGEQFRRLTGVKRATFEKMLGILEVAHAKKKASLKRFKIIADKYRNRRKRFALRVNLTAGVHNYELT